MKITRYFQSCMLIEDGNTRVLLDPSATEKEDINKFGKIDAVIFTHEHGDHFDAELAKQFAEQGIAPVYANASTAKLVDAATTEVKNGQEFKVNDMTIKPVELPHCLLWDGSNGPQNTGYRINNKFFTPGDGVVGADGLNVDVLAVPITGPDISLKDAHDFAHQVAAKIVIPVHYDYIGTKPEIFANTAKGYEVKVLGIGESTEI